MVRLGRTKIYFSTFQMITLGFALVILTGAILLSLPTASRTGEAQSFSTALFTSVSAVCVTGLVVKDTALTWSVFGQMVLLILIQIGGLGVMTTAAALALASKRRIGLMERSVLRDSVSASQVGGIVRITRFLLRTVFLLEGIGACLLAVRFVPEYGLGRGLFYALFHAVSAFCNAGFDLMGFQGSFSSLTSYAADTYVNLVICALIILGGIGFLTWNDFRERGFHPSRWHLQTKLILVTTGILLAVPFCLFFVFEFGNLPLKERTLVSLFQTVTTRTAGFNTIDLNGISDSGKMMMILLMLIGGAPGSTAGGMKVTTAAVLFLSLRAGFSRSSAASGFGRRLPDDTLRAAFALALDYFLLFIGASCLISRLENVDLVTCMFETASALGTVGLTLGLTPHLHIVSRIILMCLMYTGRVGGLTLAYALKNRSSGRESCLPEEAVAIG